MYRDPFSKFRQENEEEETAKVEEIVVEKNSDENNNPSSSSFFLQVRGTCRTRRWICKLPKSDRTTSRFHAAGFRENRDM